MFGHRLNFSNIYWDIVTFGIWMSGTADRTILTLDSFLFAMPNAFTDLKKILLLAQRRKITEDILTRTNSNLDSEQNCFRCDEFSTLALGFSHYEV